MVISLDPTIDRVAVRQHGVITRHQLHQASISDATITRWCKRGWLITLHPGVFRLAGAPESWHQSMIAATLVTGGVASHRAAAFLWGLLDEAPVELCVERPRLPRPSAVVVHRSRDLSKARVRVRHGVPVTDPMRAVIDCGAVLPAADVSDILERGLVARLYSVPALEWAYTEVAKPGRRGCGVLRRLLDVRALGYDRPDSLLEPRMARLLANSGLPAGVFQHPVVINGRRYRIDFAWPGLMVAVEVDGWKHRATPEAMRRLIERQNALVLAGWLVLRFDWDRIVRRPHTVVAELRPVLGASVLSA